MDQARTVQAVTPVPADVQAIFERSCHDCHSSRTRWPRYGNKAPASWHVADHLKDGRAELSFSGRGRYQPNQAAHKLEEICKQVEE